MEKNGKGRKSTTDYTEDTDKRRETGTKYGRGSCHLVIVLPIRDVRVIRGSLSAFFPVGLLPRRQADSRRRVESRVSRMVSITKSIIGGVIAVGGVAAMAILRNAGK